MNILLNQNEIEEALKEYVSNLGVDLNNKAIEVFLTAGRGDNGYKAEISITAKSQMNPVLNIKEVVETVPEVKVQEEDTSVDSEPTSKSLFD